MLQQNQVVAMTKDRKERFKTAITQAHHLSKKRELFDGLSRVYRPNEEGGEQLPPESKRPQTSVGSLIASIRQPMAIAFDTVLTQDYGNTTCMGDVQAEDGERRLNLAQVPVSHLLFLEKQLVDLATFVDALPTLDPSEEWTRDENTASFRTPAQRTVRTKKVPKPIVLAPATQQHPAQVQLAHEDVSVGIWEQVKFSGALPATEKAAIQRRIVVLQEAVKKAREKANSTEVPDKKEGTEIFEFIFGA